MSNEGQLTLSAFIFKGVTQDQALYERARQKVEGFWGMVEICYESVIYAEFMEELYQAIADTIAPPGVVEYEVAEPFGRWWVHQIALTEIPSVQDCHTQIAMIMEGFFTMQGRSDVEEIRSAISDFFKGRQTPEHEALGA